MTTLRSLASLVWLWIKITTALAAACLLGALILQAMQPIAKVLA